MESDLPEPKDESESRNSSHSLLRTVEQLLYEDEGNGLDFKAEQYPFASATEEQRGELVKDILAMVNSWSRADTRYILLGVKEAAGGRAEVLGVSEHLPEHSLQQLVNSRLNRPLELSYHAIEVDGVPVGVIAIPRQERPTYVRRAFGKVRANTVYLRRGSSTAVADPDEVAQMGASNIERANNRTVELRVQIFNPDTRDVYEGDIHINADIIRIPPLEDIPDYRPGRGLYEAPFMSNEDYYRDLARYLWAMKATLPLGFYVHNTGDGSAANVMLWMEIRTDSGYRVLDSPVEFPSTYGYIKNMLVERAEQSARPYRPKLRPGAVLEVRYDLGTVQPGLPIWTDPFYLVVERPGRLAISLSVFSDQLAVPKQVEFAVEARGEVYSVSPEAIVQIAHDPPSGDT